MNFEDYLNSRVDEVAKKTEIETALKNSHIIVGTEFEFIHNELEKYFEQVTDEYENALADWNDYIDSVSEWNEQVKRLKSMIDKLDDKARKLKSNEFDIKLEELEDELTELKSSSPDIKNYSEYMSYIESWIFDVELPEPGEDVDEPPDPTQSDILADIWLKKAKSLNWSGTPFTKPIYGFYGETPEHKVGDVHWVVEPDQSIGNEGVEIISPPLPLPEMIKSIEKMFKYISKNGHTTSDTGFHVHMSIKGINDLSKHIDPVKLILFTDEEFIFKVMKDRANNSYVYSVKDKLKSQSTLDFNDMKDMLNTGKVKSKFTAEHNDAINFTHWKKGHIEFRHMGGRDYHKKFNSVKTIIGQFSHNIALAVDPEYKKKEYTLKLQRIFNKIELFELEETNSWLNQIIDIAKLPEDKKIVDSSLKMSKGIKNRLNTLKKIYKLDNKTKTLIKNNKDFMVPLNQRIKNEIRNNLPLFNDNQKKRFYWLLK